MNSYSRDYVAAAIFDRPGERTEREWLRAIAVGLGVVFAYIVAVVAIGVVVLNSPIATVLQQTGIGETFGGLVWKANQSLATGLGALWALTTIKYAWHIGVSG